MGRRARCPTSLQTCGTGSIWRDPGAVRRFPPGDLSGLPARPHPEDGTRHIVQTPFGAVVWAAVLPIAGDSWLSSEGRPLYPVKDVPSIQ